MTTAATTARATPKSPITNWVPAAIAGVAAIASLTAAIGGSTDARLVVAIALPATAGTWIRRVRRDRPHAVVLALLTLLGVAGLVHVALTSPAAAWVVDSHMAPPALLTLFPSATARIAVAWSVPLLWATAFLAMAVSLHRGVGTPVRALLLLAVGVAPLLVRNAFPTDAYRLLWDSTALGHLSYAVGAWTVLLVTILTHDRATKRSSNDRVTTPP